MVIWRDTAYIFNDGGHCRAYNLKNKIVIRNFNLSIAKDNTHANSACFGVERSVISGVPYIYIAECKNKYRCFVEEFVGDSSFLVQTITASYNNKKVNIPIWSVDADKGYLYCIARSNSNLQETGYAVNTLRKFKLPKIADGPNIELSEKDIVTEFDLIFPNVLQDAVIKDGIMYISVGYQQSYSEKKDSKRAIIIVDLKKQKTIKTIDLTFLTTNEPEGLDFYGKKLLLFCGQEGGIYQVRK